MDSFTEKSVTSVPLLPIFHWLPLTGRIYSNVFKVACVTPCDLLIQFVASQFLLPLWFLPAPFHWLILLQIQRDHIRSDWGALELVLFAETVSPPLQWLSSCLTQISVQTSSPLRSLTDQAMLSKCACTSHALLPIITSYVLHFPSI